jgi:hypothetical protein
MVPLKAGPHSDKLCYPLRMRAARVAILLVSVLTLFADTRTATRTSAAGQETICSSYVQGKNERLECVNQDGSAVVTIRNSERNVVYQLDLASRKYVESQFQKADLILTLAAWDRPSVPFLRVR